MKRLIFIFLLNLFGFAKISANDADLFKYDKPAVNAALSDLSIIENYVAEHPALAIECFTKAGTVKLSGLDLVTNPFFSDDNKPPLLIPSFWWGFVFSVAGVGLVYLASHGDKEQTRKAWIGCAVSGSLVLLTWFCIWMGNQPDPKYYYYTD